MRGQLSDASLERIERSLPRPSSLSRIGQLVPESVALHFDPDSGMGEALVCLRDAADFFKEASLALHECKAAIEWYGVQLDPPDQRAAILVGRFYADDVALRLYSAAEHLAAFLQSYLGIPETDLEPYSKARTSRASKLGTYLIQEMPQHDATEAVKKFIGNEDCKFVLDYRNKWVHEQRPRIAGLGMGWERGKRWKSVGTSRVLSFGMGDEAVVEVDELVSRVAGGLEALARLLDDLFALFWASIKDLVEIRETEHGFEILHPLR